MGTKNTVLHIYNNLFFLVSQFTLPVTEAIINSEEYISKKNYYFRFANFTEEMKSKILTKKQD